MKKPSEKYDKACYKTKFGYKANKRNYYNKKIPK